MSQRANPIQEPRTEEEWSAFRFPIREPTGARFDEDDEGRGQGEEGEGEEGGDEGWGGMSMEPLPPKVASWFYDPDRRAVFHPTLRKQVPVDKLDESIKVIRIIAAIEARSELDVEGFVDAMESAAQHHHGLDLLTLLRRHSDGSPLTWSSPEPVLRTRRRRAP